MSSQTHTDVSVKTLQVTQSTTPTPMLPMGEFYANRPLPYNRFAGNPPTGVKATDAFEAEMGFPYGWRPEVDAFVKEQQKAHAAKEQK